MRFAALLLLGSAAWAQAVNLVDFETSEPADGWKISGLALIEVTVDKEGATATDGRALRIESKSPPGYILRPAPVTDWRTYKAVSFFAKVEAKRPVKMRLRAIRGNGPAWRVRRFELKPGGWREVVLPLKDFRENTRDQVCGFDRIDQFMLKWDQFPGAVTIDDLRLLPGDRGEQSCLPTQQDHMRLAFPSGGARAHASKHFLLLTNRPEVDKNGTKLLARFEEGLEYLRTRFHIEPAEDDPAPVYIYSTQEQMHKCIRRLGERYGVGIDIASKLTASAYLSRAVCCYISDWGWDRPSFLNYAMKAALYRSLGVSTQPNWVSSGLANAVQIHLHPDLLENVNPYRLFRRRELGEGPLLEWDLLFASGGVKNKLQYATIFEYFADAHGDRLPEFWKQVRASTDPLHEHLPGAMATLAGLSLREMEKAWLQWGLKRYAGD